MESIYKCWYKDEMHSSREKKVNSRRIDALKSVCMKPKAQCNRSNSKHWMNKGIFSELINYVFREVE